MMPAPLGNQYAVGHGKGRPRTVCPADDELIALGEEMIEWIRSNPNALHVSAWYSCEMFITRTTWDTMCDKPVFIPYYELALSIISQRYLHKDGPVKEGISQRWQRVYFRDLRKQEDKDKDDDVLRQKAVAEGVAEDVLRQGQQVIDQLISLRNSPTSSNSNE